MTSIDAVYYFPINGEGEEVGEPIKVSLNAAGEVDLSALPEKLRETLESTGAPDEVRMDRVYPKEGTRFLEALLRMTNGYIRFRTAPERV